MSTVSGPIEGITLADVPGHVDALGDALLTDLSTVNRDYIEVGLQPDYDSADPEPLILEGTDLTPVGGSMDSSPPTGAHSTSTIEATLTTTAVAVCSTGGQPHMGAWTPGIRVQGSSDDVRVRLAWRVGEGPWTRESWKRLPGANTWYELPLAAVNIAEVPAGVHTWEGRIEAYSTTGGDTVNIDFLDFMPARKSLVSVTPEIEAASLTIRDEFNQAAGNLHGKTIADSSSQSTALSPGTLANDASTGSASWSNPSNAAASDDSRAVASMGSGSSTNYLKATNFGFAIPAGAVINGIVVEVERQGATDDDLFDNRVRIVKGGTIGTTDRAKSGAWPSSDAYARYGSSSDMWGETWTETDIEATGFGVAFSARCKDGQEARVDHIRVTVHYTESGGQTWSTTGDTTDLAVEATGHTVQRSEVSDAAGIHNGRLALAGTGEYAAAGARVDFKWSTNFGNVQSGVLLRYTDTSNFLVGYITASSASDGQLAILKRVAGTNTTLATLTLNASLNAWQTLALLCDATGQATLWYGSQGAPLLRLAVSDSALATGGALEDGKVGFVDHQPNAATSVRNYDNFAAWQPTTDHVLWSGLTSQLTHERYTRVDSSGSRWGGLPIVGRYLTLPPSTRADREHRLVIKSRKFAIDEGLPSDGLSDDLDVTVSATPRVVLVS